MLIMMGHQCDARGYTHLKLDDAQKIERLEKENQNLRNVPNKREKEDRKKY